MVDRTLLPANATPFERSLAATFERIQSIPVPIRAVKDPQACPLAILPWLAWERQVAEWDAGWTEVQKRTVVASSYDLHRHAATRWAVVTSISQLGFAVQHQCWFEYGDTAHRFRLVVTLGPGQAWTNDNDASLVRLALRAKGAHDRLAAVNVARILPAGGAGIGAVVLIDDAVTFTGTALGDVALPPSRTRLGAAVILQETTQFASAA